VRRTPPAEQRQPIAGDGLLGALVEVENLTWRPFGRTAPVLAGMCLRIEPGQRVLLAGASGSGKSTLLRAIAGVLTATESGELAGSVQIDGRDPQGSGAVVGLMVQDPADASVAGQAGRDVAFGLENESVPREEIWPRVRKALASVTFPYGLEHPVNALSGGEAQRLALAGVLVLRPGLMLLDEPSSMLDPEAASAVREAIWSAVATSGATVVLVEHHLGPWLPEIDRVIVLDADGTVAEDGTVAATVLADPAALAARGVWVPGVPAPHPLDVPSTLCAPAGGDVRNGEVVVRAEGVGMLRALPVGVGAGASGGTVLTLTGADVVVRAGEIVALVGPTGAGKSTLASLLAGLERPSFGSVTAGTQLRGGVDGSLADWSSADLARRVGWVPQQPELAVVASTVRGDVLSTVRALKLDELVPRAESLMRVLGLAESAETDPHHLSGGQLRRLALAGAVAHGPALLVLDEPTVGQDRQTWAAVAGVITAARDAGAAVVVATHDRLLMDLADRCIRLEHGRVSEEIRPSDVSARETAAQTPRPASTAVESVTRRGRFRPLGERCGPLSLLGSAVLLLVGALFITHLRQGLLGVAVELLLAPLVLGWRGHRLRRVLPGLLAVASVWFSTWLLSPHQDPIAGATAGLRIAFFVLPGVLLVRFIDPFALGDHLAQRLRLPGRPVVAAVAAFQRFEGLADDWRELRRIRRVRGLASAAGPIARARDLGALTFALLVQSLRQAARMAVAIEARGFSLPAARRVRRTWAQPAPWLAADTVLTVLAVVVAAIPVAFAVAR
jgi:energy-coupling factor transporter ATP-binding protein EcfA2/energy-coupling factor transporter transmembrane protein EcfT